MKKFQAISVLATVVVMLAGCGSTPKQPEQQVTVVTPAIIMGAGGGGNMNITYVRQQNVGVQPTAVNGPRNWDERMALRRMERLERRERMEHYRYERQPSTNVQPVKYQAPQPQQRTERPVPQQQNQRQYNQYQRAPAQRQWQPHVHSQPSS